MPHVELPNSTYLDLTSYRTNGSLPVGGTAAAPFTFNVALVLERAHQASAFLNGDWGSRQQQLAALDFNTLWSTYGADPTKYADALSALSALGISTVDQISPVNGYVSSPESRTIWVQVNETNFTTLFGSGAQLLEKTVSGKTLTYWEGNLKLPDTLVASGVKGVMFDGALTEPVVKDHGGDTGVILPQGPQSPGNAIPQVSGLNPNEIAAFYDYPFNSESTPDQWLGVQTGTIGLLEPGMGTQLLLGSPSFQELADAYRATVGVEAPGVYIDVAPGGANITTSGERSLDVGIVTAVSPTSPIAFYAGSGVFGSANSGVFTAYQAAFWDTINNPEVVSSSWRDFAHFAPDSPFAFAYNELFIDAVLRNITMINAVGDGGSGDQFGNGKTNADTSHSNPHTLVAGGTSLSTLKAASQDPTLTGIAAAATAHNPATLWALTAGGLTVLPSSKNSGKQKGELLAERNEEKNHEDEQQTSNKSELPFSLPVKLIETVWNGYFVFGQEIVDKNNNGGGYNANVAGAGGVDPSHSQPTYQTDFGLNLVTSDPDALPGRGAPDVAALAGGNLKYNVPQPDMTMTPGVALGAGTSAAAPMWAALVSQFNAIFKDQDLPQLGFMNDLLYISAAIAPAAFNDVTLGNNTSSFSLGGSYLTPTADAHGKNPEQDVTPAGFGYSASPGYDLTTGLGTPNGLLLARALTAIAHQQVSFATSPAILEPHGPNGWTSTANQSLLVQTTSDLFTTVSVLSGSDSTSIVSLPSDTFAWTSRFAQQTLQSDFDPRLIKLFDKQSQGAITSISSAAGDDLAVTINAQSALAPQGTMTTPFGFMDFVSGGSDVRVARPIAVAQTVDALDNQQAIIRMRQTSTDKLVVKFYRVDDFSGTIDGLAPGDPGYAAAANARAYTTTSGGKSIKGPGYLKYGEAALVGVGAGDLIAMQLSNGNKKFWAFADANEKIAGSPVTHLWNYGLNTWGWEDKFGGGDRDFNDLVVQLDFTSAYGDIFGPDDKLMGGNGDDDLSGLGGSDTIKGEDGNDILRGGRGNDFLNGGGGIDTFVFADGDGADTVLDYQAGKDLIDLTDVAGVHAFGDLVLTQLNPKTVLIDFDGVLGGDTLTVQKTTIAQLTANQGGFLL